MTKKLLIIHTGGTISMEEDLETNTVKRSGDHPLLKLSKQLNLQASITEEVLLDLPSPHITMKEMGILADRINNASASFDGIIITHGTDTLEETAYFLSLTISSDIPVFITGAMRSNNELGADGLFNLTTALSAALEADLAPFGPLVLMNSEFHLAAEVYKHSSVRIEAFKSLYGPIATVVNRQLQIRRVPIPTEHVVLNIPEKHTKTVHIIKIATSMNAEMLKALLNLPSDGFIIEAYGQGNIPAYAVELLEKAITKGIHIIITSKCREGYVEPTYDYIGGGAHLKEIGAGRANLLTSEKAALHLTLLLENGYNVTDHFSY